MSRKGRRVGFGRVFERFDWLWHVRHVMFRRVEFGWVMSDMFCCAMLGKDELSCVRWVTLRIVPLWLALVSQIGSGSFR